jgi:hypothetical protein
MSTIQATDVPTLNQNTTGTAGNVSGIVAIANGGTGQNNASDAFNALSPITTAGDIIVGSGTNAATRLAIGTAGLFLKSTGATAVWDSAASVSDVSVVSANGFAGTVANSSTTPAITLKTTVTGLLKGDGTAISAATSGSDYAPATSGTSILYGNGAGGFSNVTIGSNLSFSAGILSASGGGGGSSSPLVQSDTVISTNYSLGANKNAMSFGATTIAPGVSVTIASPDKWLVTSFFGIF